MEQYHDGNWDEGRNIKKELSKKAKSKRRKNNSIQRGINAYFRTGKSVNQDDFFDEKGDDICYH